MTAAAKTKKLYCYVDETGQDTRGEFFLVAVVVLGDEREQLRRDLEEIELKSGKRSRKWSHTTPRQRRSYMRSLLARSDLANALLYSVRHDSGARSYMDITIQSTAEAILTHALHAYTATVFVDGLRRPEQQPFAAGLRRRGVAVHKVRGINDRNDALVRLADAVAGFVRDCLDGEDANLRRLYDRALVDGKLTEV